MSSITNLWPSTIPTSLGSSANVEAPVAQITRRKISECHRSPIRHIPTTHTQTYEISLLSIIAPRWLGHAKQSETMLNRKRAEQEARHGPFAARADSKGPFVNENRSSRALIVDHSATHLDCCKAPRARWHIRREKFASPTLPNDSIVLHTLLATRNKNEISGQSETISCHNHRGLFSRQNCSPRSIPPLLIPMFSSSHPVVVASKGFVLHLGLLAILTPIITTVPLRNSGIARLISP